MKRRAWRAGIVTAGLMLFFYSSFLMREFEHSGMGRQHGLTWALGDVFTAANFGIAAVAGLVGSILVEAVRSRLLYPSGARSGEFPDKPSSDGPARTRSNVATRSRHAFRSGRPARLESAGEALSQTVGFTLLRKAGVPQNVGLSDPPK
jgi:hypothetical protein